jgi:hypothetical protein
VSEAHRWSGVAAYRDDNGPWVTYADHVAAVGQAKRDTLAAAMRRVEQLDFPEGGEWMFARAYVLAAIKGKS